MIFCPSYPTVRYGSGRRRVVWLLRAAYNTVREARNRYYDSDFLVNSNFCFYSRMTYKLEFIFLVLPRGRENEFLLLFENIIQFFSTASRKRKRYWMCHQEGWSRSFLVDLGPLILQLMVPWWFDKSRLSINKRYKQDISIYRGDGRNVEVIDKKVIRWKLLISIPNKSVIGHNIPMSKISSHRVRHWWFWIFQKIRDCKMKVLKLLRAWDMGGTCILNRLPSLN
jgi:hypothetical protein